MSTPTAEVTPTGRTTTGPSRMLWTLMLAGRLLTMDFDRVTAAHAPWTSNTGFVVFLLAHSGPMPVGTVAARCGLRDSTLTGILDKLTQQGLVERQPDPLDRRRARVALTEAGHQQVRDLLPVLDRASDQMRSPLTAEEQLQLQALLTKLVRARVPGV